MQGGGSMSSSRRAWSSTRRSTVPQPAQRARRTSIKEDSLLRGRTMMKTDWFGALALALCTWPAYAAENETTLLARLQAAYPQTRFTSVTKTAIDGLYEVMMGANVVYV